MYVMLSVKADHWIRKGTYNLFMETSARGGLTAGVFLVLFLLSDFMDRESLSISFYAPKKAELGTARR